MRAQILADKKTLPRRLRRRRAERSEASNPDYTDGGDGNLKTYLEIEKLEAETGLLIHNLTHYKLVLRQILKQYDVESPSEIEEKIKSGETGEHPAYEDYLDAISYEMEIDDLWGQIQKQLQYLKE